METFKYKRFIKSFLVICLFFVISTFLEKNLIQKMYTPLKSANGSSDSVINETNSDVDITVKSAKASRMNGEVEVELKNNSDETINGKYLKYELYTNTNDKAALTRYLKVDDLKPGESKTYKLKFNAGYIDNYKVSLVDDYPDEKYTFEVFGYEINTRNIFGIDVSKYVNIDKLKGISGGGIKGIFGSAMRFIGSMFGRFTVAAKTVPWWAYLWAWTIFVGVW